MTSREQIESAADRYGWDPSGETLTGAAIYRHVKGRMVDLHGPALIVHYGMNGRVNSASFSRPSGNFYGVAGGRNAIIKILREHRRP